MSEEYLEPQPKMAVEWPMPFKIKETVSNSLEVKSPAGSKATLAVPQVLKKMNPISDGFYASINKNPNPSNGAFNNDESHLELTHVTKKPSFISTDAASNPANFNNYIVSGGQMQLRRASGAGKMNQAGSSSDGEKLHSNSTRATQSTLCNGPPAALSKENPHGLAFNARQSHSKFTFNAQSLPFSPPAAFHTPPVIANNEYIDSSKVQFNDQFDSQPALDTQTAQSIISSTIVDVTVGLGSVFQYDAASESASIAQSVPYTPSPAARVPFVSVTRPEQHLSIFKKTMGRDILIFGSDSDSATTTNEGPSFKNDELFKGHQTTESAFHAVAVPALTMEEGVEKAAISTTSESINHREKDIAAQESILNNEEISNLERAFKHSTIHASKHHLMHYLFPSISALRPDVAVDIADKFMTINSKNNIIAMINDPELFNVKFAEYSQEYDLPAPKRDVKLRIFLDLVGSRAHRDQVVRDYFIDRVLEFQEKVPAKLVESFCAWGDEDLVYLFGDRLKFVDTISDFTWSMDDE